SGATRRSRPAAPRSCALEHLYLDRRAVVRVRWTQFVLRALRDRCEAVHLGAELDVVARLGHRLAGDPLLPIAVVLQVEEDVERVGDVLGRDAVRPDDLAHDLETALVRPE